MPQKEIPSCSRCFSLTCWCLLRISGKDETRETGLVEIHPPSQVGAKMRDLFHKLSHKNHSK